jgi:transposase
MYIETVPNRNSPPCILLRESYRVGSQVKKRTLLNLTHWPIQLVEDFRTLLRGGIAVESLEESFEVIRERPHGHVAAILGTFRRLGLERILSARRCRERDWVVAMIVARIIEPASKLATARGFSEETCSHSLGKVLEVESASEDDLYAALDWLGEQQARIEKKLAQRHLKNGVLVLYDLTSAYFEGRTCPLARYGHPSDGRKGKLQIVFGLLCTGEGIPVAVEVFEGNTKDSKTVGAQIKKIREQFGLQHVVLVGDRGMITQARIDEELRPVDGLEWISALKAPQIRGLVETDALQLSLFDERDLAEIQSPDYPGERLMACRNPLLAQERSRKREELLQATEKELDKIVTATHRTRSPLKGQDKIGVRVGKVLGQFKVAKHFHITITDENFRYERNTERIDQEKHLDGIYVIRTSVPAESLNAENTVGTYKRLSTVERAFRTMKTISLKVRPIFHRLETRVRAHVFLCMLAYYVEWHMRNALAPILFQDDDVETAEALRDSVVAPAKRSPRAEKKAHTKRTQEGQPVHSFQTLLDDLATITISTHQPKHPSIPAFEKMTIPTPLQQHALDLLGVRT